MLDSREATRGPGGQEVRWSGQERGNVACCLYFFTYNINVGLSYTNLFMNFVRVSLASLRDTTNGQLAPAECGRRGFKSSKEIGLERDLLSTQAPHAIIRRHSDRARENERKCASHL